MIKFAIVYFSYGGNTRDLAIIIKSLLEKNGHIVHIFSNKDIFDLSVYDCVLFGSLTWENAKMPIQMRKLMKRILIEEKHLIKISSVFGTGETQWGEENFCRAVDEIEYHLLKHGVEVKFKLKIEQNPIGKELKIEDFVNNILEELN